MGEHPTEPPPPPPDRTRPPLGTIVVGGILVLIGAGWLLEEAGVTDVPWDAILPGALILIGIVVATAALRGRSYGGLTVIGIILTVVLALGTTFEIPFAAGVGERVERPTSLETVEPSYELAVGKLEVDLSGLEPITGDVTVTVRVGVGEVQIRLGQDVLVDIQASSGIGETVIFGEQDGGFGVESIYRSPEPDGPVLRLDVSTGIGKVEVNRG